MIAGYAPDSVRLGEHDLNSSTDCEEVNNKVDRKSLSWSQK